MIAYVILNGEKTVGFEKLILDKSNIYCADGGANILFEYGLVPKIIMGDMDSIKPEVKAFYERQGCEFTVFKSEKDETDGQLIVDKAAEDGAVEVVILCGLGKRLDHTLGNIQLLYRLAGRGIKSSIIGNDKKVIISPEPVEIERKKGEIVSLIPYSDEAVVDIEGFRYSGKSIKLERSTPLGISNYVLGEKGIIVPKKGSVVIMTEMEK